MDKHHVVYQQRKGTENIGTEQWIQMGDVKIVTFSKGYYGKVNPQFIIIHL